MQAPESPNSYWNPSSVTIWAIFLALIFGIIALVRKPAKSGVPISGTALGAVALIIGIIFSAVYAGGTTAPSAADAPAAANTAASSFGWWP